MLKIVFLFLMIVFQSYLWRTAAASPRPDIRAENYSISSFILYELPIFVAGACCILLRFRRPNELKPSTTYC